MFTSYFGNKKQWSKHSNIVAISVSTPHYYNGKTFPKLYPTMKLIQGLKLGHITEEKYKSIYYNTVLKHLNPEETYMELGEDAVLLCWDTPNKFCHRFLVAEWFKNTINKDIEELPNIHTGQYVFDFEESR
mgnify:FL=1